MAKRSAAWVVGILVGAIALGLAGCAPKLSEPGARVIAPGTLTGPGLDPSTLEPGQGRVLELGDGTRVRVLKRGEKLWMPVQATLTTEAFSLLQVQSHDAAPGFASREFSSVTRVLQAAGAEGLRSYPEVGFVVFEMPYRAEDVLGSLKGLRVPRSLLVNPVTEQAGGRGFSKQSLTEGLPHARAAVSGPSDNAALSGLERIHAPEFVRQVEAELGGRVSVDGSSVRLGITDTGITLNHPTFCADAACPRSRVVYLKDFTREGRVYFAPSARFDVQAGKGGAVKVTAQVIKTPSLPDLPRADALVSLPELEFDVSEELRGKLLAPGSRARLGILWESSLQGDTDPVDLNANGKKTDMLPLILIPGATSAEDVVYFDPTGMGDFRASVPLRDWNIAQESQAVGAERMGFALSEDTLVQADGTKVAVRAASLVGFDPGNHGSHVAGIAAGRATLANDPANDSGDTLARGVAPAAQILMNRVCANAGGCGATEAFVDVVLNGHAEVVNMSIGGLSPYNDGYGVEETLINRLTDLKGAVFVISAGNSGPGRQTVGNPSTARYSLSIGATATPAMIRRQYQWPADLDADANEDFMLFFSSRGPTAAGGFKPSLSAPGTELSSIQLHPAPGQRGGLDVFWGTSMAAPAAAGAITLLKDAIKKFNLQAVQKGEGTLPTDALTLRQVLMESARPIGQYTWMDQGAGMVDLVSAWAKLKDHASHLVPTAVRATRPVALDYPVWIPMKSPTGVAYDGTRAVKGGGPIFGTGIYLDFFGKDQLHPVAIGRRLTEAQSVEAQAADWIRQLRSTEDRFELRVKYTGASTPGSDEGWLKAGVMETPDCWESGTSELKLTGDASVVDLDEDGTSTINFAKHSTLYVCVNRGALAALPAGDHGALISAYRKVGEQAEVLPSFTVPVSVTVPHHRLAGSEAFVASGTVPSFGVNRHYVFVPPGTSLVRMTLEAVPAVGQTSKCSSVELMAQLGRNDLKPFASRKEGRAATCDAQGRPDLSRARLTYALRDPKPGIWDVLVFGSYTVPRSGYRVRVDYVTTRRDTDRIEGGVEALRGQIQWSVAEGSLQDPPDSATSEFVLDGLLRQVQAQVEKGQSLLVPGAGGSPKRVYASDVKSVRITTSGSPGNDLDLAVLECEPSGADSAEGCAPVALSSGATDEEQAVFTPRKDRFYLVRVDGFEVHDQGKFSCEEVQLLPVERGTLEIAQKAGAFTLKHGWADPTQSRIFKDPGFAAGELQAVGALDLKTEGGLLLDRIWVRIRSSGPLQVLQFMGISAQ